MLDLRDKKYAIYIAERLETDTTDEVSSWHHTFLMLVDETTQPITILQQLHFNDDFDGSLLPNVRLGLSSPQSLDKTMVYPLIGGAAANIFEAWNAMLSNAFYLKNLPHLKFGENYKVGVYDLNCRAAIIASLKSIGIVPDKGSFAQEAGIQCSEIPASTIFNFEASGQVLWSDLEHQNIQHQRNLTADWIGQERYMGPVPRPLKLIGQEPA